MEDAEVDNFELSWVKTSQDALIALERKTFDLIFMDCHMPVLDGYDATRMIRNYEGENEHRIIIALTANILNENECIDSGMDDFLTKPITKQKLFDIMYPYCDAADETTADNLDEAIIGL